MKWISVEDELPEGGHEYLCMTTFGKMIVFIFTRDTWYFEAHGDSSKNGYVTHWMPLPPAPINLLEDK